MSPQRSVMHDDFDIQHELLKDPSKRYKVEALKKLLDDKLSYLINTLEKQ